MASATVHFSDGVQRLEKGKPLTRQLAGNEGHAYEVVLAAGEYAHLVADQQGVDVAVRLLAPDGKLLTHIDSPNGKTGPEPLSILADAAATYRVEVVCEDAAAPPGRYVMQLEEVRPATSTDRKRVRAERRFADAEELRRAGQAASNQQALDGYRQVLQLWRDLGDSADEAQTLDRIGRVERELGHSAEALAAFQEALPLFQRFGQPIDLGRTFNFISAVQHRRGDFGAAATAAEAALGYYRQIGDPVLEAGALNNLGNAAIARGEADRAATAYRRALDLAQRGGSRAERSIALYGLGDVLTYQGKLEAALDTLQQALQLLQQPGSEEDRATTLSMMANVYQRLEDYAQARALLEQALALRVTTGDRRGQAVTLSSLGTIALRGHAPGAAEAYGKALELFRAAKDRHGEAIALLNLGRAAHASGDQRAALARYTQAASLFEEIGNLPGEVQTLFGSAQALHDLGEFEAAERRLERVLDNLEVLRGASESLDLRTSYLATKQHYYDLHVDVLMHLEEQHPGAGHAARALGVHETRRARGLLDMLLEARADLRRDVDPALLTREKQLQRDLNEVARSLMDAREHGLVAKVPVLEERQRALLLALDAARTDIRRHSPRYAAIARPEILDIAGMQREVVSEGSLLLVYSLGEERSFLWAVPHQGRMTSHVLPARAAIEGAAREAVGALSRHAASGGAAPWLASLSAMLLRPVATELARSRRLLIVADGALEALPAAALPDPNAPAGQTRPLVRRHVIVYLPSASTLATLRRELADRLPASRRIAVLADPVFGGDDPRLGGGARTAGGPGPAAGRSWDLERSAREVGAAELGRLPFTRDEARVIEGLVPEDQRFEALGFEASRATVLSGELARYRILHFATHGLLNQEHPELSGLVLSLYDKQGKPQDGFLRGHEIATLHLPAELAVLSACETGLGGQVRGEGLVGLTRSFMNAGVPRIVVSLWQVSDRGTAELMRRFYTGVLEHNLSFAAALQQAQESMLDDPHWQDPYYWAPFVFQGDWRMAGKKDDGSIENPPSGGQMGGRGDGDLPPPDGEKRLTPYNGVNGSTGRYLDAPTDAEIRGVREPPLDLAQLRQYRWWVHWHGRPDDPDRAPVEGVDPLRLDSAGWGVIYAPDVGSEDRKALEPLLNLRRSQARSYFQEYEYRPGMTKQDFLAAQQAGPGPADPKKVPYYLLLVGSPRSIPFRFQYELDVQYAVGRLFLGSKEAYASYADGVVAAEAAQADRRRQGVTFFGVCNPDDDSTERTTHQLIEPLAQALAAGEGAWRPRLLVGEQARKAQLGRLLGGGETPALLFTASHGMAFPDDPERMRRDQGALLCQDWPGPKRWEGPIPLEQYFGADDVPREADVRGLIAFHFACHSAGTPAESDFEFPLVSRRRQVAPEPMISRLAQRLLGHPGGGALAVLGHIDRAWTTSFSWVDQGPAMAGEPPPPGQIEVFESTLRRLLKGHPVGSAMEYVNQRHAELSVELSGMWADREDLRNPSLSVFSRLWRA
ncbi:MAG TPA: CHAT domain-containing tetratricopeptide repeat protein, partial [Thermoanaerobaculia bacterium]